MSENKIYDYSSDEEYKQVAAVIEQGFHALSDPKNYRLVYGYLDKLRANLGIFPE